MPTSDARVIANRKNAQKSTGPRTTEGKDRSKRNGLKHGLTGQGIVILDEDTSEVDRRNHSLQQELAPKSVMGAILVQQLATLSVRMERIARQECASVAARVRHAAEDFDQGRIDQARAILETIRDDPRRAVRQLRNSPEGIELMLEAWGDRRLELTRDSCPKWTDSSLEMAANLIGSRLADMTGSRLDGLARATWGYFGVLPEEERVGLDREARMAWARARLIEWIDQQVAELEAHARTLDDEIIEQDRAEAGDRALFDPSREAGLARRYESEARRGFFKALDQFRKVEAEAAERLAPETHDANQNEEAACGELASSCGELASSCQIPPSDSEDPDDAPEELAQPSGKSPSRVVLTSAELTPRAQDPRSTVNLGVPVLS